MVLLVVRPCSCSHKPLSLQATSVLRGFRSKFWSSSPRQGPNSSVPKVPSHFQWRVHASVFLNRWTSGTLSLEGGQIAEWVPIISSAVGVHMELLDQAPETLSCGIISAPVRTTIPSGLPWSSKPSLCVASLIKAANPPVPNGHTATTLTPPRHPGTHQGFLERSPNGSPSSALSCL